MNPDDHPLLARTVDRAAAFLDTLPHRPVRSKHTAGQAHAALDVGLTDAGVDDLRVIDELVDAVEPGLVASAGPRYFGFVTGGSTPAALAVDWLVSAWDQNAAMESMAPAATAAEAIALRWAQELIGLPATASGAIVVGAQAGNTMGVTIARDALLRRAGWNVDDDGLAGGPPITVMTGTERHLTLDRALRFAGLGAPTVLVDSDPNGALDAVALRRAIDSATGPIIICAQAGNVNSGAFDPFAEIVEIASTKQAWVHVDGAFGLWAGASPERAHLVDGAAGADSWVVDAHKWLNVPYDSALFFCAHPDEHHRSTSGRASYLPSGSGRDPIDWSQDSSRRARGLVLYAALRSLGRHGVADLVNRCCGLATSFAQQVDGKEGLTVRNDVVLNQVVIDCGDEKRTAALVQAVQDEGTFWAGPTRWQGSPGLRISVSNWSTTEADIERSTHALLGLASRL